MPRTGEAAPGTGLEGPLPLGLPMVRRASLHRFAISRAGSADTGTAMGAMGIYLPRIYGAWVGEGVGEGTDGW